MRVRYLAFVTALAITVLPRAGVVSAQDQAALQAAEPPAGGMWIDSLDLSDAPIRRPRAGRGAQQAAPPAPLEYTLGGVTYRHGVGLNVNTDLAINLEGTATRFLAVVGHDEAPPRGRNGQPGQVPTAGSVTFDVWVDGRHVSDSGLMTRRDAPKLVSVDLRGARKLVLSVNDGGDGPAGDGSADWAGAVLMLAPGAQGRPQLLRPAVEATPPIASSRSTVPLLNSPRITGATPGRPFMFMVPASGEAPLTFAAEHLPAGLSLDPTTGIISGSLATEGRTVVTVTVKNARGSTTGDITIVGGRDALALTPPLGWNSWNAWGNTVTAERVRASADGLIASGLARQGYTYVNIDDVWEGGERRNPDSGRDANGRITTNANFPDMKRLVDYIHGLGLKAGIYSSPGPTTCQGLVASFGHEAEDARTWAEWGFDYLKYDWCSYQGDRTSLDDLKKPYRLMRNILDQLDRDVVFSMCQYGWGDVWEWGDEVGGNLWRVTGDIRDSWDSMSGIGFQQTGHEAYAGPGHWNDTDMLVVGMVGWSQGSRPTRLTPNEQITHISLWTLQAAPLIIGADLAHIDEFTTNLLGNREVLAVNQDVLGRAARRISGDGRQDVWARPLADGTMAVGLFNRAPEPQEMSVRWADLGLGDRQAVRDLWRQHDLGVMTGGLSASVPRHGALLVKVGTPVRR